ncbi:MAG: cell division protein FtsZ [Bacteroidales bacterium]|nr:cell division protein FtsZ [Bacteroidales bacterium]MCF6342888.1 cell division protein FtsZ [Bacteroidales bacterium]
MIQFEPKQQPAYIKVIGVGGGGSNAVNHMFEQGIKGVEFTICNTDVQALAGSPVPNKIRIGDTNGLGAGAKPEVGEEAAKTSIEALKEAFTDDIKMVFITAGMGGGTGTGAAPIIAQLAKEKGVLTVGIVTLPFGFEGRRRKQQAEAGIKIITNFVDTLLVINNDKLRELYGNLPVREAFARADNVLSTAAKGIAEIITVPGYVNTDFEDVKTVIQGSGKAIMGSAQAEGENRAKVAIEEAMNSPLLDDNDIEGAQNILLHIVTGTDEITMDEISDITEYVQTVCGNDADLIWGQGFDESLGNKIGITLIATGFDSKKKKEEGKKPVKIHLLDETEKPASSTERNEITEEPKTAEKSTAGFIRLTKKEEDDGAYKTHGTAQTQFSFSDKISLSNKKPAETGELERGKTVHSLGEKNESFRQEKAVTIDFKTPTNTIPDQSHLSIKHTVSDAGIQINTQKQPVLKEDETLKKNSMERVSKLKSMSRLHNSDISNMESVPAYQRKNLEIDNTPPSSTSTVSRFTLGQDSKNNPVIKSDNSYLHDNVD